MAQILEQSGGTFSIPLTLIVADPKKNSRTAMDDTAVAELAETIKREGQLAPVKVEKREDGKFDLVYGYRRFAAFKLLAAASKKDEFTAIRAEVAEAMDPITRKVQNLAENIARENLSTFDQATAFFDLKKTYEYSANKISNSVGKSVSYVNNLTRVYDMLDESILKRWKEECDPKFDGKMRKVCTMDWLTKLAAKTPKAEQEYELRVALGLEEPDDAEEDDEEGDSKPRQPAATKRATMKNLAAALEAAEDKLKKSKKDGADDSVELKAVISALKFAIGKSQSIRGVYTTPQAGDE